MKDTKADVVMTRESDVSLHHACQISILHVNIYPYY